MVRASDATGLLTSHLVLVVPVIILVHITRRNARVTVARRLRDGRQQKLKMNSSLYFYSSSGQTLINYLLFDHCSIRYHVPRSWLNPTGNLLVVFEEWGGDPNGIHLVRRDVDSVCVNINEWQPTLMNWQMQASGKVNKPLRPKAHLSCGPGQKISSVKFASFGTPEGECGSFREGSCHAHHSYDAFQRVSNI